MRGLDWSELGSVCIPLRGKWGDGKYAIVDGDYDGEYLGGLRWSINRTTGYVYRASYSWERERGTGSIIYLHQMVLAAPEGMTVDHINRDKLDNRSVNLRAISFRMNTANRNSIKNTAKYRGVNPMCGRYQAICAHEFLGSFQTEAEAALVRDRAAYTIYGEFGIYNFPERFGLGDNNRHKQYLPS